MKVIFENKLEVGDVFTQDPQYGPTYRVLLVEGDIHTVALESWSSSRDNTLKEGGDVIVIGKINNKGKTYFIELEDSKITTVINTIK